MRAFDLDSFINPEAPECVYLDDHSPMLKFDIPPKWIEIDFLPPSTHQTFD